VWLSRLPEKLDCPSMPLNIHAGECVPKCLDIEHAQGSKLSEKIH